MSEQSSHESDRTAVHDPQPAGFPAEKTAVDTGPTPDQGCYTHRRTRRAITVRRKPGWGRGKDARRCRRGGVAPRGVGRGRTWKRRGRSRRRRVGVGGRVRRQVRRWGPCVRGWRRQRGRRGGRKGCVSSPGGSGPRPVPSLRRPEGACWPRVVRGVWCYAGRWWRSVILGCLGGEFLDQLNLKKRTRLRR